MSDHHEASYEALKAVVRRNTLEVQSGGNFELFDELFADDFLDHTPQPGGTPDKEGARRLYHALREAFPDFHAEIHWQAVDGDIVTTFKTYHGTHQGVVLGSRQRAARSSSKPSTPCAFATARSSNTGGSPTSTIFCSNSTRCPPRPPKCRNIKDHHDEHQ
ncbi:hypothetical protein CDO30_20910 (plasmid) [Sinorhizobium meliloti]|uniref:Ester cyclase n=1 Tax=Rhizobium meliloti (strain 1021) TaxID=266834 RepID=Q930L4_RHIME|nr:ester cyclase [Sinorhizobium meliloti]AAK64839.1 hypothetical protein SMa0337 [Sinorhizobium meliloti 1021]AGG69869.1 Hypothetical protein SM2011_a0337 [Sinorhizobium meliloti 2011]ASP60716.1 hypothetical protein CDO30_20910 [Sinorhizobium meliloti]MQW42593.1 hypothetical protein [Sinorhizobium meliloti]RVL35311.1 hypothetical protein CN147_00990 [Sinorhizobium meliloti]